MKLKKMVLLTILAATILIPAFWSCQQDAEIGIDSKLSRAAICTPATVITAPFTYDGIGEYCWEIAALGNNINSWNLAILEVNGTAYTNLFVNSASIAPVNNKYVIHYKSSVAWGHFEIVGAGNTGTIAPTVTKTATKTVTRTVTVVTRTATRTLTVNRTATRTATVGITPSPTCSYCAVTITGSVTNAAGQPISGAAIIFTGAQKTTTDSQGVYSFTATALVSVNGAVCPVGDYYIAVTANGYVNSQNVNFSLSACKTYTYNFTLVATTTPSRSPTPTATPTLSACPTCTMNISGSVKNSAGQPITGVSIYQQSIFRGTSDTTGNYSISFSGLKPGGNCPYADFYLYAKAPGYLDTSSNFTGFECATRSINFVMPAATPAP